MPSCREGRGDRSCGHAFLQRDVDQGGRVIEAGGAAWLTLVDKEDGWDGPR